MSGLFCSLLYVVIHSVEEGFFTFYRPFCKTLKSLKIMTSIHLVVKLVKKRKIYKSKKKQGKTSSQRIF